MEEAALVVGGATGGTGIAAAIGYLVREYVKERRARVKIAQQQTEILIEMKAALVCLPTLQAALAGFQAAIDALHDRFEERTRWMIRERRPTPLREEGAPAEVDPDLTPAPGLRAARDRARTPPGGVGALKGRYHHRGDRGGSDK